jgi:hypothetical protein
MKFANTVSQTGKRSTGTMCGDVLNCETKCESMEWRTVITEGQNVLLAKIDQNYVYHFFLTNRAWSTKNLSLKEKE